MDATTKKQFEGIDETIIQFIKHSRRFDVDVEPYIQPFLATKEKCLRAQLEVENASKAMELAKQAETRKEMHTILATETKRLNQNIRVTNSDAYTIFQRQLDAAMEAPLDVGPADTSAQYVDPLTREAIEIPVRNKFCGHIYEKATILNKLNSEPPFKCPFSSCKHDRMVNRSHLEDVDPLTLRSRLNETLN